MINEVLYAITRAINTEFPDKDIHIEDVAQGLNKGSFLVTIITPSKDKVNVSAYTYNELVAIQYFPLAGREEINEVSDRLNNCLEIINVIHDGVSKKTRTEQTGSAVVDGVLTLTIRVSDIYYKVPQGDEMDAAEIGVKHG